MARDDEPIRPMTLGGMRRQGVRGLFATCLHCGHERAVNIYDWPDIARRGFSNTDRIPISKSR